MIDIAAPWSNVDDSRPFTGHNMSIASRIAAPINDSMTHLAGCKEGSSYLIHECFVKRIRQFRDCLCRLLSSGNSFKSPQH